MAGRTSAKKTEEAATSVAEVLKKIDEGTSELKSAEANDIVREADVQKVAMDEEIPCKSLVFGGLTWVSPKTNAHYRWNGIGDIEYIPFSELVTLNNTSRPFLHRPLFVVQDERVVKYFRLLPVYEKVARINDLDKVLSGSLKDIEKVVDDAISVNMRSIMVSKIRSMRKDGRLNNIDVINLLGRKLGFDFTEDSPEDE